MTRPDQQQRGHQPERDAVPGEGHALARPHPVGHGGGVHARAASPARAPPRRTHRRDARNRGTCRGSRRRATAAPCRPDVRRARRRATAASPSWRAFDGAHAARAPPRGRRILADQHRVPHLAAKSRGERREVLALALAARDQHQRARASRDRRHGRAHVRALRVVDVAHARDVGDPLPSGAAAPGKLSSARSMAASGRPAASPSASAASALAALCRPVIFMRAISSTVSPRRASKRLRAAIACSAKSASGRARSRTSRRARRARRRRASPPRGDRRRSAPRSRRARRSAPWRARSPRSRRSGPCGPRSR